MSIKTAIEGYFERKQHLYDRGNVHVLQMPYDDTVPEWFYTDSPNREEIVEWRHLAINKNINFREIEEKYQTSLPDSIKEYFLNYWFWCIEGFYHNKEISLFENLPTKELDSLDFYLSLIKERFETINFFPIGTDEDSNLILIKNGTFEVYLYDGETEIFIYLEADLELLINKISLRKHQD